MAQDVQFSIQAQPNLSKYLSSFSLSLMMTMNKGVRKFSYFLNALSLVETINYIECLIYMSFSNQDSSSQARFSLLNKSKRGLIEIEPHLFGDNPSGIVKHSESPKSCMRGEKKETKRFGKEAASSRHPQQL